MLDFITDFIKSLPSVAITVGLAWAIVRLAGKKYVDERIAFNFKKKFSKIDLSHKHKFSIADEERKAIYDVSASFVQFQIFFYSLTIHEDLLESEVQLYRDMMKPLALMMTACEKLTLIRLDFSQQGPLLNQMFNRLNVLKSYSEAYGKDLLTFDELRTKLHGILSDMETNEWSQLRGVLNGYLKEISR